MSNSTVLELNAAVVENVGAYITHVRITHLATLGTATFLVYDICLTFDDEFDYVWRSRLSYAKVIFLLNRYLTIILFGYDLFVLFAANRSVNRNRGRSAGLTELLNSCKINGLLAAPASMPNMFFVSTIFMMRTYALYERSRLTLIVLVVTYILCFAPAFVYFYIEMGHGLSAEAWTTITDVVIVKKFLAINRVDMTQGWWPLLTCTSIGVPPQLGAIMLGALVYESGLMFAMVYKLHGQRRSRLINRLYLDGLAYYLLMLGTLVAAAFGCFYSTTSRAWVASRYFVGMKSVLCSRMILRLRWYSSTGEAQSPTFGGQEEALATGTDIFFAEADKNAKGEWTKNEDFGIEVPVGSLLSHGAGVETYAAMAMVPVKNRGVRSGGEVDLDLEGGYSLCEECMESQGEEEVATLKSTPSVSLGVDTSPTSRSDPWTRNEGSAPGPSRPRGGTSSLPPEG